MTLQVIKSTPKTFQYGTMLAEGLFRGVTVKADNLVYDPVSGLPISGTVKWIEYINDTTIPDSLYGTFVLSNLTVTAITDLIEADATWFEPSAFQALIDLQDGADLDIQLKADPLEGSAGDDTITVTTWQNYYEIDGKAGDDVFKGGSGADSFVGGSGADKLYGGAGQDRLEGGADADSLFGGDDADSLWGQDGADTLKGGDGNDVLMGDRDPLDSFALGVATPLGGNDRFFGGAGNDLIYGESGDDRAKGEAGRDTISGGEGSDVLFGGADNDVLNAGDILGLTTGDDRIYGGTGNDLMTSDLGDDRLFGGDGDDGIVVRGGNDRAFGGAGSDFISVEGAGTASLTGGADADQFLFVVDLAETGIVSDFNVDEDRLALAYTVAVPQADQFDGFMAAAAQFGQHVEWTNGDVLIRLRHVDLEDLTVDHFFDAPAAVLPTY